MIGAMTTGRACGTRRKLSSAHDRSGWPPKLPKLFDCGQFASCHRRGPAPAVQDNDRDDPDNAGRRANHVPSALPTSLIFWRHCGSAVTEHPSTASVNKWPATQ